jgi:predicted metalloprotease with PDZ domain
VITRLEEGRLVVTEVRRETPAHAAGINVGDEILAIDEQRVPAAGVDEILRHAAPGSEVAVLVARRGRLRRVPVVLGEAPVVSWRLELDPDASRQQCTQRARWLEGT